MAVNEPHGGSLTTAHIGLNVPWVQYVGRSTPSPTSFNLSWGSNQAVMTVDINMADLLTAIPMILGTAQRTLIPASRVTGINLTSGGSGYQTQPAVVISGGGGSGARGTANLAGGTVISVTLTNEGGVYTGSTTIQFVGGAPPGASLIPATANTIINNTQVPFINRTLPMRYPYVPHMICTKIQQGQPLIFSGLNRGSPGPVPPIPDSANYQYCRLTLLFQAPGYTVMDDATLLNAFGGDESERFVEGPKRVNTLFQLTRKGADFQWTETSTTGNSGPKLTGTESLLNFGVVQPLAKQQIVAKWLHIPEDCLFPDGPYGPSPNIDACYPGVNAAAWNGQEAGTVLFDNWHPEIEEAPYPLSITDFIVPQRLWSVEFSFRLFNPTHDPGNSGRGWNLQPWRDGVWYFASQTENRGIGVVRPVDFNSVFMPN